MKKALSVSERLQHDICTDWVREVPAIFDSVLQDTRPCLKWPYKTEPQGFIRAQFTGAEFLSLPPIFYVVSFRCKSAVNVLRHMVNELGIDINARYAPAAATKQWPLVRTTPLGWFLYVTSWRPEHYYDHESMLETLLQLGANTEIPVVTD